MPAPAMKAVAIARRSLVIRFLLLIALLWSAQNSVLAIHESNWQKKRAPSLAPSSSQHPLCGDRDQAMLRTNLLVERVPEPCLPFLARHPVLVEIPHPLPGRVPVTVHRQFKGHLARHEIGITQA